MQKTISISRTGLGRVLGQVLLAILMAAVVLINLTPFLDGEGALLDFGSFYAAGEKSLRGENPYDPDSEYIFEIVFDRVGAGGKMVNLNPPVSVLMFRSLARFEPQTALAVWQALSALLYAGTVLLLAAEYRHSLTPVKVLWAFLLAGAWHTIVLGQIYIALLFLGTLGWIWLKRGRPLLAGLAIGLVVAIKPNFILWPLFLLVSGSAIAFLTAVLSAAIVSAIPIPVLGVEIYRQWLSASALRLETLMMPGNSSIVGLTSRFGGLLPGILLSGVIVLALLVLAWSISRRRPAGEPGTLELVSALGILASLLSSPISWTGYTILLLPIFFSLKRWTLPLTLSAVILAVPFQAVLLFFQTSFSAFVLLGWLYGWALLILLGVLVRKAMTTSSIQTN